MRRLTHDCHLDAERALESLWQVPGPLRFDFSTTEAIDAVGAALLLRMVARARAAQRPIVSRGLSAPLRQFLGSVPAERAAERASVAAFSLPEWVGALGYGAWQGLIGGLLLVSEMAYFALDALRGRRRRVLGLRAVAIFMEMEDIGARAVPVVALIGFLVGLTVAMQSAVQLRPFGATVFVVDLIGLSVCRELGPLLAAIVVAGRSGAACAAQIATMVVTEEVDALKVMGIDPTAYTVLPKLLAILLVQPLVALCASAAAIFGAYVIGIAVLDIPSNTFFDRLAEALMVKDLLLGVLKSMVFGALIVFVAARSGYTVVGGAEGVGHSTTRSVVTAIFCIIVADALFSLLFYSSGS